jgi:trans-aconitate 2-methyltransferase
VSGAARDWDAGTYHRVSDVHQEWAAQVLDRLGPVAVVLDAGCGSGRVTQALLARCERVIAVDAAPSMVAHARETLGERATVLQQDLLELTVPEPVDAVFSNAVFHWVPDHPRLFERLHSALKPGGQLEAQYGGHRNVEKFHEAAEEVASEEPYATYLKSWTGPWNFTTDAQAEQWLADAGFVGVRTWLEEWPMMPSEPREYIRTVCLGHHLQRLPPELRAPYVDAVASRMPREIDYVRLNISARRAAA